MDALSIFNENVYLKKKYFNKLYNVIKLLMRYYTSNI